MKKQTKRIASVVAMALAFSLAIPQTVTTRVFAAEEEGEVKDDTSDATAATGSAADAAELRKLIKANLIKDYDPAVTKEMDIVHEVRSNDASDILVSEAQSLKERAGGKTCEYQVYDINRDKNTELFMLYPNGVRGKVDIYRYDDYDFTIARVATLKNVTELHKVPKKKQIVIVTIPGANKMTITTYKLTDSGKLKSVSVYTRNKKTYKNGKKKITKKAFDKYYKSVKKIAKIKTKKIPNENYTYTVADHSFYSKDLFSVDYEDELGTEALFMSKYNKDDKSTVSQDKCIAYTYAYDRVGKHEFSAEPGLTRYVFGPDVVDKKTGKTYQEEDWDALYKKVFAGKYAPWFLMEGSDENGKVILEVEADGELHGVTAKDCTSNNGGLTYKAKEYSIEYGDCQLRMVFFTEGPQAGRISEAGMYYPHVTGDVAHEKWTFIYAEEAGNGSEHDPQIYDWVTAGGVDKNAKIRTLSVDATDTALTQTIMAAENVSFELFTESGQFYTYKSDGKTEWALPEENSEENWKAWREFDDMLNPANGQLSYGDAAFTNKLYWKAK